MVIATVIIVVITGFLFLIGHNQYEKRQFLSKVESIEKANLSILDTLEKTDQLKGTDSNRNFMRDDIEAFINLNMKDDFAKAFASFYVITFEGMLEAVNANHKNSKESVDFHRDTEECVILFSMVKDSHIPKILEKRPTISNEFIMTRQILMKHKDKIFLNNEARQQAYAKVLAEYPYQPRKPFKDWTESELQKNMQKCVLLGAIGSKLMQATNIKKN